VAKKKNKQGKGNEGDETKKRSGAQTTHGKDSIERPSTQRKTLLRGKVTTSKEKKVHQKKQGTRGRKGKRGEKGSRKQAAIATLDSKKEVLKEKKCSLGLQKHLARGNPNRWGE